MHNIVALRRLPGKLLEFPLEILKNSWHEACLRKVVYFVILPILTISGTLFISRYDLRVSSRFQNAKTENRERYEIIKKVSKHGAFGGVAIFCGLILGAGGLCRSRRLVTAGLAGFLAASTAGLINNSLKLSGRPRPDARIEKNIEDGFYGPKFNKRGLPDADFLSFPSGHSATAFGAATAVAILLPPMAVPAVAAAGAVAFSRVYILDHYPSDVFFASMIGIICGLIFALGNRRLAPQKTR